MKRFELLVGLLLIPLDFFMLLSAAATAYFLRFEGIVLKYRPAIFELEFSNYLQISLPLILLWVLFFALSGLYSIGHPRKILTEVKKIIIASLLGFAAITILIFLRGELFNSRFIVLAGTGLAILYVIIARSIVRLIKFRFYKRQIGVRRLIVVGDDKHTQSVIKTIKSNYRHGLMVTKRLQKVTKTSLSQLAKSLSTIHADGILMASVNATRAETELVLDFARDHHLQFAYVADLFNTKVSNTEINAVGDLPIVEIKQTPLDGWGRIEKRVFDLFIGSILLLLASPFMIVIAVLVKLTSKGPILYKNQRVGKGGRLFFLYKFRRFKQEYNTGPGYDQKGKAEAYEQELVQKQSERRGPIYKVLNDPRNTPIGAFLEKWSLDELPQFFNVLKGEISLVGPRPHQPREVEGYEREHKRIFVAKPGLTGLAQISGRSDLDYEDEARLDVFYIENWSLRADIAILLKTPFAVLKRHK